MKTVSLKVVSLLTLFGLLASFITMAQAEPSLLSQVSQEVRPANGVPEQFHNGKLVGHSTAEDRAWSLRHTSTSIKNIPQYRPSVGSNSWSCSESGGPTCYANIGDIYITSPGEYWALDLDSNIYHVVDGAWESVEGIELTATRINSLSMAANDDGWAVGFEVVDGYTHAIAFHWNGAKWSRINLPNLDDIRLFEILSVDTAEDGTACAVVDGYRPSSGSANFIYCWNGIEWALKYDGPNYIRDVQVIGPDSIWMLRQGSDRSIIAHWNGTAWEETDTGSVRYIEKLDFSTESNGWAIYPSYPVGSILRWDGSTWVEEEELPDINPLLVTAVGEEEAWIVDSGNIYQWDGNSWTSYIAPASGYLAQTISMSTFQEGVIAGRGGTLWTWDGKEWKGVVTPSEDYIADISMISHDNGWAIAQRNYDDSFLRYDGKEWTAVASPIPRLFAIEMIDENDGWAIGQDAANHSSILHWDGVEWKQVPHPLTNSGKEITELVVLSSSEVFVLGQDPLFVGGNIVIMRWNGKNWSIMADLGDPEFSAHEMLAYSATDIWIFGMKVMPAPLCASYDIYAPANLHWDGVQWKQVPFDNEEPVCGPPIIAAGGTASNDIWTSNHYRWDGIQWQDFNGVFSWDPVAIDFVSPSEGWAVSGRYWADAVAYNTHSMMHWDGETWIEVGSPCGCLLMSLDMVSANEGWAGGEFGAMLHFTGPPPVHPQTPPEPPGMFYIEDAEQDGNFLVKWPRVLTAVEYQVAEQYDSGQWNIIYSGTDTRLSLEDRINGKWCYRLRASNAHGTSDYGWPVCTTVTTWSQDIYLPSVISVGD